MKKDSWKFCLDIIMVLLLTLMYNKSSISMGFHEIGGLVIFGLFLVHKFLNIAWIVEISQKIFGKGIPFKIRFSYIVDSLFLGAIIIVILSGIMISKVLFSSLFHSENVIWKISHYSSAVAALILCGIHIGLHWHFIKCRLSGIFQLPRVLAKALGILCIITFLIYGGNSLFTSSFMRWITMPFSTISNIEGGGLPNQGGRGDPVKPPENMRNDLDRSFNGDGMEKDKRPGDEQTGSREPSSGVMIDFEQIISTIATYSSIIFLFSIPTFCIDELVSKNRTKIKQKDI